MKKYKRIAISLFVLGLILIASGSYSALTASLTGTKTYKFSISNFEFVIGNEKDPIILNTTYPLSDNNGKKLKPYTFSLTNSSNTRIDYKITLKADPSNTLSPDKIKYFITEGNFEKDPKILDNSLEILEGSMEPKETKNFTLRLWLDYNATIEEMNKVFKANIYATAMQQGYQTDGSGAPVPIVKGDLVPIKFSKDSKVIKADISKDWYNYDNKEWANAVILEDKTIKYNNGDIIPEENIESYFVWIPRFKFQIFDTSNNSKINIQFEDKNIKPSLGTKKGEWLTHPAFTTLDVNGIWAGKFETVYKGSKSKIEAQKNEINPSKVSINKKGYYWTNISVYNAFNTSYNYKRDLDSHLMKNTEWGAIIYFARSKYGRDNNYYSIIDMENSNWQWYTYKSSTTYNETGIYNDSYKWEYVMAYNDLSHPDTDKSGFTKEWFDNPNNKKYYDRYIGNPEQVKILGDGSLEFDGLSSNNPNHWIIRGGSGGDRFYSYLYSSMDFKDGSINDSSFRITLAPKK